MIVELDDSKTFVESGVYFTSGIHPKLGSVVVISFGSSYSIAGARRGLDDPRGDCFFCLERALLTLRPRAFLFENVRHLLRINGEETIGIMTDHLRCAGYFVTFAVLNASSYGNIPQNRERLYIIGFRSAADFARFRFPDPIALTRPLSDFVGFNTPEAPKYYYTPERHAFFPTLNAGVVRNDILYQWRRVYVREPKSGLSSTLTANMGTGGHNVPIIRCVDGVRKLTPRECFNLMGFPTDFALPECVSDTALYSQAGNSVVVPVIERLALAMKHALD